MSSQFSEVRFSSVVLAVGAIRSSRRFGGLRLLTDDIVVGIRGSAAKHGGRRIKAAMSKRDLALMRRFCALRRLVKAMKQVAVRFRLVTVTVTLTSTIDNLE